jgi:hypothetical protein
MPILTILAALSVCLIAIGVNGFTHGGMRFSKKRVICGNAGKLLGTCCILGGILLIPTIFLVMRYFG